MVISHNGSVIYSTVYTHDILILLVREQNTAGWKRALCNGKIDHTWMVFSDMILWLPEGDGWKEKKPPEEWEK